MAKKQSDTKGPSVPTEKLSAAVVKAASDGFLGMLSLVGQSGVKVQTDAGSWPLPEGDYVVLMLKKPLAGPSRVAWIRVADENIDAAPAAPIVTQEAS